MVGAAAVGISNIWTVDEEPSAVVVAFVGMILFIVWFSLSAAETFDVWAVVGATYVIVEVLGGEDATDERLVVLPLGASDVEAVVGATSVVVKIPVGEDVTSEELLVLAIGASDVWAVGDVTFVVVWGLVGVDISDGEVVGASKNQFWIKISDLITYDIYNIYIYIYISWYYLDMG